MSYAEKEQEEVLESLFGPVKLVYRDEDYVDGAFPSDTVRLALLKLETLGYNDLAQEARRLNAEWPANTLFHWQPRKAERVKQDIAITARTLVRFYEGKNGKYFPWRLFLKACNWPGWVEEAFPRSWR